MIIIVGYCIVNDDCNGFFINVNIMCVFVLIGWLIRFLGDVFLFIIVEYLWCGVGGGVY